MTGSSGRGETRPFALSIYWFAWEVHWAALLGAAMQAQVARFIEPTFIGRATAVLGGLGAICSIAAQLAAGRASDRRGKRMPFIVTGTMLDVVALFGFALAPSFAVVVAAFAAVQLSLNIAGGPYQALIPDRVPKARLGRASAVMGLFRLSGSLAGLALAHVLVKQPGSAVSASQLTHGLLLLAGVLSAVLLAALAVTVGGVQEDRAGAVQREARGASWPMRKSFAALLVSRVFVSLGLYSVLPFFAFYLEFALHVRNYLQTSVALLIVMNACSLVGTWPAGVAGDRVSKKKIMAAAIGLLAIASASMAAVHEERMLTGLAIGLGVGWGAYYSVDWALACNLLPAGRAGSLMAVWNIGASAPQVAAPVIGGLLVDRIATLRGDPGAAYRDLFLLISGFLILGAATLIFVREAAEGKKLRTE
ncbi:MAG: MFS transporter [Candidatus Eremiobacteraeota bacterium]|nr:MFS transporter [Candidatus Eremiobacteraeota bacterium]MBC5827657.1 MFS transporter [Candidatus Eremiobacteraeota bacterium]